MQFKAVIFDLDGTLLDTLKDIAIAADSVLAAAGWPTHSEDEYQAFVGSGASVLMRRALPEEARSDEQVSSAVEAFGREYARIWRRHTTSYPGIAEMLDRLTALGLEMAVLSNKPHEFTVECVDGLLNKWRFSMILGNGKETPPKPDPTGARRIAAHLGLDPREIMYVGDTGIDMRTAAAAGMFSVGVLWGFRSREELEENGAGVLVSRPQEIIDLLA